MYVCTFASKHTLWVITQLQATYILGLFSPWITISRHSCRMVQVTIYHIVNNDGHNFRNCPSGRYCLQFIYMSYGLWDVGQIYIIINSFVTALWAEPIRIIMNKQVV